MATYYIKHKRTGKYFTGVMKTVRLKRGWTYKAVLHTHPTELRENFIKKEIINSIKNNFYSSRHNAYKNFKIEQFSVQKVKRVRYGKELDMHAEFFTELLNG